ncbi:MAG: PEP/pyruvate-binding domain-containing protein [Arachnia sp.]
MAHTWSLGLHEVRRGDVALVGGKAANLGELLHAGFPVPGGFVLTTDAYRSAVGDASISTEIEALTMPENLAQVIRRAYSELPVGPVAVRSSATAEDLPGAAFAGQHDTHLNVEDADNVIAAVRSCWASLFSERAVAYRKRLGIEPDSVAMAVVVQSMVPADMAGVMFTANPVTGARNQVVIDAAAGLGEAVVSGDVIPEHFVVDAKDGIIDSSNGEGATTGVSAIVGDDQLWELATVGRRIAEHFGHPQDVEWALHSGHVSILQSRAMTALPPAPITMTRLQRALGSIILELIPRRPLPMELTSWIVPIAGAHLSEMIDGVSGVAVDVGEVVPERDAIVQELVPPRLRPTRRTPIRLARSLGRGLRRRPGQWQADPRLSTYRRGVAELNQLDPSSMGWDELVAVVERTKTLVDIVTELRIDYLPAAFVALAKFRLATLFGRSSATVQEVLGSASTMTRVANQELDALARSADRIPELRELLLNSTQERAAERAPLLPPAAQWWVQFQDFLASYGHRETTSILLVHDPTWGQSPATVIGLIQVLLDPESVGPSTPLSPSAATAAHSGLMQRLAQGVAEAVALREDTHFELSRVAPIIRGAIVEMGRRLVGAGELADAQDVWMLTLGEVTQFSTGTAGDEGVLGVAARRRRIAHAEQAANPLIATTTLYPGREGSGSALVVGAAGGGGRATGRVRIISTPADFGTLRAGEVLVCQATNPSWTPLFLRAAAVVVDRGGMASHAAIVAREYGIPAVMGAATATTALHDGQLVTVDGDVGEVTAASTES